MSARPPSEPDTTGSPTVAERPESDRPEARGDARDTSSSPPTVVARPSARGKVRAEAPALPTVERSSYEILDEYARGGLGRIVRARDTRTGRTLAIKEMLSNDNDEIARRFVREARVTANLQHPAIVPVYEIGKWPSGEPFYAMKLVAGSSLAQVIEDAENLDERLARLPVVEAVADALAYAHGQRVIHRDLKPANVIVGEFGETIVIDWGLAKLLDDDDDDPTNDIRPAIVTLPTDDRTVVGTVLGTPYYMPPEQARGQFVDERADVYAIGAMLYHLITGHAPYTDRPAAEREKRIAAHAVTPILSREPEAPPDLVTIAEKAMDPDPAKRYPSARELADELRRFTRGQLVQSHRYDRFTLIARWLRHNRTAVIVASVLLAAATIGGVIGVTRILAERDNANRESAAAVVARREADHQAARAREGLATALYQKGRAAEQDQRWALATMYYSAARVQHDTPAARWAAGLAEARAIVPHARHVGHAAVITDGVFASDDASVITVDEAGVLRVWSLDGKLLREKPFSAKLHAVAAHGNEIAIGDAQGTITRLSSELAPIGELRGHAGAVLALAYSHDGAQLASGGEDKTARVWKLADGSARSLAGHTQTVMSVAFSRDDSELATGSDDRTVRVWKLATGASEERAHHVSGGVNAVVRGHASDLLISSGWDFAINIAPATSWFESHSVHALALSNDDRVIAAAGDFGEVHLWDVSTHKLVARLDFAKRTTTLAFSHDGRWLLSAGQNKLPVVWDVRSLPRHVDGVGHRANVVGVAFTQDGSKFATSSDDNTLRLWDTPTGDELARIATASPCVNPVILRSGELVASCDDKTLRRWSTDGVETGRIATDVWLRFSALSPDGKTLAAGHMRGRMALVDVATWKVTKEITAHAHQLYTLDYAPTGELVTSGLDAHVKIWSPTLALLRDVTSKGTGVFGAAIDPAHEHIVAVSQDGAFEAWHFADAAPITRTQLHEGAIWKLVYAHGTIYTASEDGTAKLVEPKTWRLVRTLEPGEGALDALGVSPDGKTLVVGSRAGGIVLYDTATWKPRRRIGGHARDHGSCDDVAAQAWADDTHRAIVLAACNSDAASYLARYAKLSHQQLRGDVDVASEW